MNKTSHPGQQKHPRQEKKSHRKAADDDRKQVPAIIQGYPQKLGSESESHKDVRIHAGRADQHIADPPTHLTAPQRLEKEHRTEQRKEHQLAIHPGILAVPKMKWRERHDKDCKDCSLL